MDDLKNNEINDLVDAKTDLENKVKSLEDTSKELDENIKDERDKLVLIIRDTKVEKYYIFDRFLSYSYLV